MDSIPNLYKNAHILSFPYIGRAFHVLDADGSMHVWGKAALEPFPSHIKNTDTDDNPSQFSRHTVCGNFQTVSIDSIQ